MLMFAHIDNMIKYRQTHSLAIHMSWGAAKGTTWYMHPANTQIRLRESAV